MGNQLIATVLQDRVLMPQTYMYPVVSRSVHLSCRVALCDESSFCLHVSNTCFVRELEMRSHIFQNLFTNIIIMWEAIFYKSRCHFVFSKEILNNAMYKQEQYGNHAGRHSVHTWCCLIFSLQTQGQVQRQYRLEKLQNIFYFDKNKLLSIKKK